MYLIRKEVIMGKKGFTLVELLAAIVLIGLLIVLIVSKVRPVINDSSEAINEASANNLVSALEDYFFEAKLKGGFTGCSYNFSTDTNTCTGFSFTGEKPSSGVIYLSDEGVISGSVVFDDNIYEVRNGNH